jgi:hypothetical protein
MNISFCYVLVSVDLNSGSIKIGSFLIRSLPKPFVLCLGSIEGDVSVQCEKGDVDAFFSSTGASTIRAQGGNDQTARLDSEMILL